MSKEIQTIQQLESGRTRIVSVIDQANVLINHREAKVSELKEQVGTSMAATIEYGNYARRTQEKFTPVINHVTERLKKRLKKFDEDIEPEILIDYARSYQDEVNLRQNQLAVMSIHLAEGNLTEDEIAIHQQHFEELLNSPSKNPLLQKGLDLLKNIPLEAQQDKLGEALGEKVIGEEGKILRRLYPFSAHHIISKRELLESADPKTLDKVRQILLPKRFRLAELPNLQEEDNVGYYVEEYRPPVRITLFGDTVRLYDDNGAFKEIRLKEEEWKLLWKFSKEEVREEKDVTNGNSHIDALNQVLSSFTGASEAIVCVGDESYGNWFKLKDYSIVYRRRFIPLYASRINTLKLIFDNPATSKEVIIETLGKTSGKKQKERPLTEQQALRALGYSLLRLGNRVLASIATETEIALWDQKLKFEANNNLTKEGSLVEYIGRKLGISRALSLSETIDTQTPTITQEENGNDEPSEPSVDSSEFKYLSKTDTVLLAEQLELHRGYILDELGKRIIEGQVFIELAKDLMGDAEVRRLEKMRMQKGDISLNGYRKQAFMDAKELIKNPNFGKILDEIYKQNPNLWQLLLNLSEINDAIEKSGNKDGILVLIQNPESVTEPQNNVTPSPTIVKPETASYKSPESNGQQLNALEKRDPQIRETLNLYFDDILNRPGLHGSPNSSTVTLNYTRLKRHDMDRWLENNLISGEVKGKRGYTSYDAVAIATMLYLYDHGDALNLSSKLKKIVQKIAREEFNRRRNRASS